MSAKSEIPVLFLCPEEDQRAISKLLRLARARGLSASILLDSGDLPLLLPRTLAERPDAVLAVCRTPAVTSGRMRLLRKLFIKLGGQEAQLVAVPIRPGGEGEAVALVLGRVLKMLQRRPLPSSRAPTRPDGVAPADLAAGDPEARRGTAPQPFTVRAPASAGNPAGMRGRRS